MKTAEREMRDLLNEAPKFFSHHEFDGEKLEWIQRMNAALAQLTAPEQQAPKGSELAFLIKALRENDLHYSYQSRLAELLARQAEAAKPLFADLIAATPGAAEELKAVDAQADEIIRQYEKMQAEAAKLETERANLVNALLSLLDDQTLGLEEEQEDIIKEAVALLSADSKAGGRPVALPAITCKHSKRSDCALFDATPDWVRLSDAIEESPPQGHARPQQQAKTLSESQWEEIASLVGCVKITPRGRAAIMRVINTPDSDGIGKDQA